MRFEEKVRKMTASEIIITMVTGARKEHVKRDISSYGHVKDGICYGCVAANTICEVMGLENQEEIRQLLPVYYDEDYYGFKKSGIGDEDFVLNFELAIERLRNGDLCNSNFFLYQIGLPVIKNPNNLDLPYLTDFYTEEDLKVYEKLAKHQIMEITLTPSERIEAYKFVIKQIKDLINSRSTQSCSICNKLSTFLRIQEYWDAFYHYQGGYFPEFDKRKPDGKGWGDFWFQKNDPYSRIELMQECVNEAENLINENK